MSEPRNRKLPSIRESIENAKRGLIDDRFLYLDLTEEEWAEHMKELWAELDASPQRDDLLDFLARLPDKPTELKERLADLKRRREASGSNPAGGASGSPAATEQAEPSVRESPGSYDAAGPASSGGR